MTAPRALRFVLSSLAAISVGVGLLASVAPRAFYDEVPGVDGLPPYNQHLLTDVGGLYLGFAVLFVWAAASLSRQLVLASCAAWGLIQLLHFITTRPTSTASASRKRASRQRGSERR